MPYPDSNVSSFVVNCANKALNCLPSFATQEPSSLLVKLFKYIQVFQEAITSQLRRSQATFSPHLKSASIIVHFLWTSDVIHCFWFDLGAEVFVERDTRTCST
ncbi:hypothetical protein AMECASPLE_022580 [Ameca splendens]|uniref:Uncharacterized protein n=1 Tax=Ameca splendens TaxID=208324 RepID=A0ABV0ZNP6_9TELE